MNELCAGTLLALLRMTALLGVAAIFVRLLLALARPSSPLVHRVAWLLVLAIGWFWWRLPVTISYEAAAAQPPPPAMQTAPIAMGEVHGVAGQRQAGEDRPADTFPAPAVNAPAPVPWPAVLLAAWVAGIMVLVVAWGASYIRFLRQLRAVVDADEAWVRQWQDLCSGDGVGNSVSLRVTENLGPLVCRAPRGHLLVVPAGLWRRLAPTERLSILRHELAHWQRRDPIKSMLVRLLVLPHWFNPLAWLASRWFDEAAEWACDEFARGASVEGQRAYVKALLQLDSAWGPRLSYRAAASGRGLSVRVQRLLRPQIKEDSLMKKSLIVGIALGLALLCLVRFNLVAKEPAQKGPPAGEMQKPVVIDMVAALGEKLTEGQRLYCQWDAETFGLPDPARWQNLSRGEKAGKIEELLAQLSSAEEAERVKAIDDLVALGSKKAVPAILQIAAERREKNNWDRHTATRALGMLGDPSAVPELVHLTYHYNWNVRQWAQIALVRLTGENFGRDVTAWRRWWEAHGGKPPISTETVAWATSPEMLKYADPKVMDQTDRQWVARRKQSRPPEFTRDAKLNAIQRAMRDVSEANLSRSLSPARWQNLGTAEAAAEETQWLKQLSSPDESARIMAIYALTTLKSKKAAPGLLQIATERVEKGNRDRWMACRALGIVGDLSVVPELVPLTYHYNRDTRLWAQISLVRLSGENFGRDVAAWRQWWKNRHGKPPIPAQPVAWATSPEMQKYAEGKFMDDLDRQLVGRSRQSNDDTWWKKYERWEGLQKGAHGARKDPEGAKKLLADLVQGVYLATFRPVDGFAPETPGEFLAKFAGDPVLKSTPTDLGGGSFFRTKAEDDVLIGSFLTARPDETRKAIEATPSVKLISVEKVTPEIFLRHEASAQESLK
jgi:HEAT repeat protein/beta-lactamase regulating signal transducer with metallopeptidase domain